MFNSIYIAPSHYFFLKMTKITDFVKMTNFHQNCNFPRNMWLLFGEKWGLHTGKTPDVIQCTQKFTEENIIFT